MNEIQNLTQRINTLNNLLGRLVDLLAVGQPQFFTTHELAERYRVSGRQLKAALGRCGIEVISGRVPSANVQQLDIYFHGGAAISTAPLADGGSGLVPGITPPFTRRRRPNKNSAAQRASSPADTPTERAVDQTAALDRRGA